MHDAGVTQYDSWQTASDKVYYKEKNDRAKAAQVQTGNGSGREGAMGIIAVLLFILLSTPLGRRFLIACALAVGVLWSADKFEHTWSNPPMDQIVYVEPSSAGQSYYLWVHTAIYDGSRRFPAGPTGNDHDRLAAIFRADAPILAPGYESKGTVPLQQIMRPSLEASLAHRKPKVILAHGAPLLADFEQNRAYALHPQSFESDLCNYWAYGARTDESPLPEWRITPGGMKHVDMTCTMITPSPYLDSIAAHNARISAIARAFMTIALSLIAVGYGVIVFRHLRRRKSVN